MKKEVVTYKSGSFTDYANVEHKFIVCAVSTSDFCKEGENAKLLTTDSDGFEVEEYNFPRALLIGVAVCNPGDEWDEEKGKMIAYHKAKSFKVDKPEKSIALFATRAGLISEALVEALLTKEIQHIIDDPESIITGYNQMKSKYLRDKEVNEYLDSIPNDMRDLASKLCNLTEEQLTQVFALVANNAQ